MTSSIGKGMLPTPKVVKDPTTTKVSIKTASSLGMGVLPTALKEDNTSILLVQDDDLLSKEFSQLIGKFEAKLQYLYNDAQNSVALWIVT
jgi:hypothetical protein